MAGSKLGIGTKLNASSILEVIVAMVVIITVFTIAMVIFTHVQRLSLTDKKLKAESVLNDLLLKTKQHITVTKQNITTDDLRVDEEVSVYNNTANLYLIDLTAYDGNQEKTAELKQVYFDEAQ